MKQRLLVMNGQRILQTEQDGAWANQRVDKAGALKPGIYNLYLAKEVDKSQRHDGVIVYADDNKIYQQIGKTFVMHATLDFDTVNDVGRARSISYDAQGKAVVGPAVKLSRGRAR